MTLLIGQSLEIPEPQHYPMGMSRFGMNPHGKPLYRVVFAPSVKMLVGGRWPDGKAEYRLRPAYRQIGSEWILERWRDAKMFTGMTQEQYESRFRDPLTGLCANGPYPVDGGYFQCYDHPIKPDAMDSIALLIERVEKNLRNPRTEAENGRSLLEQEQEKERATDAVMDAQIRDTRRAFGNRPTSFRGHIKSQKTAPIIKTANELGLPMGNNKFGIFKGE